MNNLQLKILEIEKLEVLRNNKFQTKIIELDNDIRRELKLYNF